MTYSTGGLIQATDYNGFVSTTSGANVNATLSAYGQTTLSTVSAGTNTVSATQWSTLNTTIASLATHQGTSITSRSGPTSGSIVAVQSAVNTDLTNIYTNRYNAASIGSQYTAWTGSASLTSGYGSGASAWTATFTDTVTFASAAAASNFFNAGGYIKIQFNKTSTGTVADTEWNAFIPTLGYLVFTSTGASKTINGSTYTGTQKIGGSGTATVATSQGFSGLSSNTQLFLQYDTGTAYSSNYVQVYAQFSGSTLTFTTYWHSNGDSNAGSTAQISGGTATSGISFGTAAATVVTYFAPETTNITNTWGAPTVASTAA
jgi:hypothetical protein